MGDGVPAGVGGGMALRNRQVVWLVGDGGVLMTGQELATAFHHGVAPIILVFNNAMYGTIRMHQEREYPNHVTGSALKNPDFAALAQAYGYVGVRIEKTQQFEGVLLAALARPEGTLIEVMLDPEVITTRGTLQAITQASLAKQTG